MKSFTSKAAIACTIIAAITFNGVGAYAATLSDAPELSAQSAETAPATDKYNFAAAYRASNAFSASAATIAELVAAADALKAAIDTDSDDETLTGLMSSTDVALAAVQKSVAVYATARTALADQTSLTAKDLPKGTIDAQRTTAAALTKALTDLAPDATVSAATKTVTAWTTNVRGYRPAKAAATTVSTQITALRKAKAYPAATIVTTNEAANALNAVNAALNATVPQTVTLNAATTRGKNAVAAWKKSDADRAATYKTAGTVYSAASATYKKYATTVSTVYSNPLKTTMAALAAGIHTATPSQLTTLTSKAKTATANVTAAAAKLAIAKTTFANGSTSQKVYTRVPAAQKAALAKALAALKSSINAKSSPATLQVHITDVSSKAAAVKQAHINAPVREQLEWVSAYAWARGYGWGHEYIYNEDCANFASHSLYIRGLGPQVLNISSTALRNHLVGRGFRETADSQAARRAVKLGDVIQFDWQPNGNTSDRDHTGIVTRIDKNANGTITIRYTAHTDPGNDPKVNQTIEASLADNGHDRNGRVYFISI
ncbi:amidase domain-containing protein [Leifsonia sp. Leaf264]|uniref:amidase domain-containing protein n=1 Tax=Leifsonia sp. Leaf264 TaxID=1736314 RepID=UPI0006FC1E45|nr:amidase domain-containing protein [Leifsonia sp. Leaf264]KQO98640.1 hypothetical protein ASF30_11295 [Leifsonia sp. Leaf264]